MFLIEGPEPGVLVPPELVKLLDERPRRDPVLTRARYEGRVSGAVAEFDATFHLLTFDDRSTLAVPLEGVALVGDVLLDGGRVRPVAQEGPNAGYALTVKGKGEHKLELRFRVPVTALGEEAAGAREVRCGVPRPPRTTLVFKAPAGASHLVAPLKLGGRSLRLDGDSPCLEADLGPSAVKPPLLVLHWYESKPRPPEVVVREAHVWDLRPEACTLTTTLRYTLGGGATDSLIIAVPEGLEVLSAVARRRPRASTEAPCRLADWAMQTGGGRRVRLELSGPTTGEVVVTLTLVLRGPLSGLALLPLPRPEGEEKEPGQLAYRTTGLTEAGRDLQGLTGVVAAKFAADWPAGVRPSAEGAAAAFTFSRRAGSAVELKLDLRPRPEPFAVKQAVSVVVGPRRAEWRASAAVTPKGAPLGVLEWDVGGGAVTDVRGPVGRWTQSGTRLLVWPERAEGAFTLELEGTSAVGKGRLDVPSLRPVGASSAETALRVEPAAGVTVAAESLNGMKPAGQAGRASLFTAAGGYGAAFAVRPEATPGVRGVTRVRAEGRELRFDARVEYRGADVREAGARLSDWPGEAWLEADAARVESRRETHRRGPDVRDRVWRLEVSPGGGPFAFDVRGALVLDGSASVPDVRPLSSASERVLVVEPSLSVESMTGLVAAEVPADAPEGSRAWRVPAGEWSARVTPRRPAGSAALLMEAKASLPDGRRWLHEVTWWLPPDAPAEATVTMPPSAEVVDVCADGEPVLAQASRGRVAVSLGGPGVRRLRVRYRLDPVREPLPRPDLTPPRVDGVAAGAVVWTVEVPAGWSLVGPPPLSAAAARAVRDLYRAEALRGRPEAAGLVGSAERALESSPADAPRGPNGVTLAAWAARLKAEAGASADVEVERAGGSPARWVGVAPPGVYLSSRASRWPEQALGATAQWAGVWLAVWVVSLSPSLRAAGRWLWPELVALLGAAGWWLAGPTVAVAVLLAGGGVSRAALVWRGVARWWRR